MTIQTLPNTLPGITFEGAKTPIFSSKILTARDGKQQSASYWPYPKWQFELNYEFLREDVGTELETLMGFVLSQKGQANKFYYKDPYDNAVTGQAIGVGDGSNKDFLEPDRYPSIA